MASRLDETSVTARRFAGGNWWTLAPSRRQPHSGLIQGRLADRLAADRSLAATTPSHRGSKPASEAAQFRNQRLKALYRKIHRPATNEQLEPQSHHFVRDHRRDACSVDVRASSAELLNRSRRRRSTPPGPARRSFTCTRAIPPTVARRPIPRFTVNSFPSSRRPQTR